jgi:hypothetical protein
VTSVCVNTALTFTRHSGRMQKITATSLTSQIPAIDVPRVLESITSELESLRSFSDRPGLVELHGALFLYALDGDAGLLPSVGFPIGRRRLLETRVVRAAKRLAGSQRGAAAQEVALLRAIETIEQLLHLIDPDLVSVAA